MSRHTKGPWHVDGEYAVARDTPDGTQIIFYSAGAETDLPDAEMRANVHLIAKAPEMLDALRRCDDQMRISFNLTQYAPALTDVRALLAEIDGEGR